MPFAAIADEPQVEVAVEVDPFAQQFQPQLKQILKSELRFVRTVCQPTDAEHKKLEAAGEKALKDVVKKMGDLQQKMQRGGQAIEIWPDPRQAISDGIANAVRNMLSEEQSQRYGDELTKRTAARKRAAVLNLVARLDRNLSLTSEQREKLVEKLDHDWKDSWGGQLETFLYGDDFLPVLPDQLVTPVLNARQREIWQAAPKQQAQIWGWAGLGFVQVFDGDEPVPEVRP